MLLSPEMPDNGAVTNVNRLTFKAQRLKNTPEITAEPIVKIEVVYALALGHFGFDLFQIDFERRGAAA
jgi:hypothetical protein